MVFEIEDWCAHKFESKQNNSIQSTTHFHISSNIRSKLARQNNLSHFNGVPIVPVICSVHKTIFFPLLLLQILKNYLTYIHEYNAPNAVSWSARSLLFNKLHFFCHSAIPIRFFLFDLSRWLCVWGEFNITFCFPFRTINRRISPFPVLYPETWISCITLVLSVCVCVCVHFCFIHFKSSVHSTFMYAQHFHICFPLKDFPHRYCNHNIIWLFILRSRYITGWWWSFTFIFFVQWWRKFVDLAREGWN